MTRALALLVVAVSLASGCTRTPATPPSHASRSTGAPVVSTARAELRTLARRLPASGTVFGAEEVTLAAEVAGRVVEVRRDLGDEVAPGELLLAIDATDHQLALTERERAHRQVLARLGLDAPPEGEVDVDQLPGVERARLQAANARAKFERARVLGEQHEPLVSPQEVADLKTAWEVAESNVRVERLSARALLAEARTIEAQVGLARRKVECTRVAAPSPPDARRSYEVAERLVSTGEYVTTGKPLLRLVAVDPIEVRLAVPERHLGRVKLGQRAAVRIEALERPFEARVARVSPAVDAETRAFRVDLVLENRERLLKPGCFARAEIEVGQERAVVVPEAAVVSFAGVSRVFAVEKGVAKEHRVVTGERLEGEVEVLDGLAGGEEVVVRPPSSLKGGDAVAVGGR